MYAHETTVTVIPIDNLPEVMLLVICGYTYMEHTMLMQCNRKHSSYIIVKPVRGMS